MDQICFLETVLDVSNAPIMLDMTPLNGSGRRGVLYTLILLRYRLFGFEDNDVSQFRKEEPLRTAGLAGLKCIPSPAFYLQISDVYQIWSWERD